MRYLKLEVNKIGRARVDVDEHQHGGDGVVGGDDERIGFEIFIEQEFDDEWQGIDHGEREHEPRHGLVFHRPEEGAREDAPDPRQGGGGEEQEGEESLGEHHRPRENRLDPALGFPFATQADELIGRDRDAVERAPGEVVPADAVPESAEEHGDNGRRGLHDPIGQGLGAQEGAAHGEEDVVAQPGGEGDVPAVPELGGG